MKSEFVWEGSWRDICVPGMDVHGWQAAVNAVGSAGYRDRFTVDGKLADLPHDVGELFRPRDGAAPQWSVFVRDVQLNCHFFDDRELEFDLDPREVAGQAELDGLVRFMRTLAAAVDKVALMTPENMHVAPFLRVSPRGVVEYVSSGGFFEELAPPRQ